MTTTPPPTYAESALWRFAAVAVAYYLLGRLALLTALPPGYAVAVWPAAGVAAGAAIALGYSAMVPVFLASFALNAQDHVFSGGAAFAGAVFPAMGSALQVAWVRWLLTRLGLLGDPLIRPGQSVRFVLVVGPLGSLAAATVGVLGLAAIGVVPPALVAANWATWWAGDTVGAVLVAPVAWSLAPDSPLRPRRGGLALILLATLGLVTAVVQFARLADQRQADFLLQQRAQVYFEVVVDKLAHAEDSLVAIERAFRVYGLPDDRQFQALAADAIAENPALVALSWNPVIADDQRAEAEAQLEAIYGEPRTLQVPTADGPQPAPRGARHVYVKYIEPRAPNLAAVGLDIYADPTRREAAERAEQDGGFALSGAIDLVQTGKSGALGFVAHRDPSGELVGFVTGAFALEELAPGRRRSAQGLLLRIRDRTPGAQRSFLHASPDYDEDRWVATDHVSAGGRDWEIDVANDATFQGARITTQMVTLTSTLLIATLLSLVSLVWSGRSAHLELVVLRRTDELRRTNLDLDASVRAHQAATSRAERSEQRYRHLIAAAGSAIVVVDRAGAVVEWNEEAARLYPDLAEGRSFVDVVAAVGTDDATLREALQSAWLDQPARSVETGSVEVGRCVSWSLDVLGEEGAPALVAVGTDVTDRRRMRLQERQVERQLEGAKRLHALGSLAGGIAHDFNNILAGILGQLSLLDADPDLGADRRDLVAQIRGSVRRGADVTARIRALAGRNESHGEQAELVELVEDVGRMLRATLPAAVRLVLEPAVPVAPVRGEPGELFHALLNMGNNASQAMPDGGTLTFEVARAPGGEDAYVVYVRDTGVGMTEAVRERIFEAYFTTRQVEQGTGLGLATAHGAVERAGGRIEVRSTPGTGTTFAVFLPARTAGAPVETEPTPEPAVTPGRVLMVEDEPLILKAFSRFLSVHAFEVVGCDNPAEAWDRFQEAPDGFDALVTDLDLPGFSGLTLAERVRGVRPDLPVLLWTGHGRALSPEELRHVDVLLRKPLTGAEVMEALGRLLGAARSGE